MNVALIALASIFPAPEAASRCLIVGGGPIPSSNQCAIESNVRYVTNLLPKTIRTTVLFADGNPETATVQFVPKMDATQTAILGLIGGSAKNGPPFQDYRKTNIPHSEGPSTAAGVIGTFDELAKENDKAPLLLYFTGHGSPGQNRIGEKRVVDHENNVFNVWRSSEKGASNRFATTELALQLEKLPSTRPVTLVMVQCYSGSFSNIIFQGGKPDGELIDRPICGFFASTKDRSAAGCTPEVNEEDYHDFTSYFFAALTGQTRTGKKNPMPDYNRDGKTTMDEAFGWTLINDHSIDVPVATSDAFLQRFVAPPTDETLSLVPWHILRKSASPVQLAVLEGLCRKLGKDVQTDDRVAAIYSHLKALKSNKTTANWPAGLAPRIGALSQSLRTKFADINQAKEPADRYAALESAAVATQQKPEALKELSETWGEMVTYRKKLADDEVTEAQWLRLEKTIRAVYLESELRKTGDPLRIAQFDHLKKREASNPLR